MGKSVGAFRSSEEFSTGGLAVRRWKLSSGVFTANGAKCMPLAVNDPPMLVVSWALCPKCTGCAVALERKCRRGDNPLKPRPTVPRA